MDNAGRPHSDARNTVERYRRRTSEPWNVTLTIDVRRHIADRGP